MIAVDTNVLVYAHRRDSEFHEAAAATVRSLAEGRASWAIPWPCIHEFCAIVTHPRIFDPPSGPEAAADQVDAWMESPSLTLLGEPHQHWPRLRDQLTKAKVVGPRVHDARIGTICAGHRVNELLTIDRDFTRFTEVKVRNPLV